MTTSKEQKLALAHQAGENVTARLKLDSSIDVNTLDLLSIYRSACQELLFQDFHFAKNAGIEDRLWDIHDRINKRFRKQLSSLRQTGARRKPVELRKTARVFLRFIKASQYFYRSFIQALKSCLKDSTRLDAIASRLTWGALSSLTQALTPEDKDNSKILSCYWSLIRLGDLSRWREMQLLSKNPNWVPAINHYTLAGRICPASGASHNQLAMIALQDATHLCAVYHLYRSLAAKEPHPLARKNLTAELRKVEQLSSRIQQIQHSHEDDAHESIDALEGSFVQLHVEYFRGADLVARSELENEVLSHLVRELKMQSLSDQFHKLITINLAAECAARKLTEQNHECLEYQKSFDCFQRFNVKTMTALLHVLQAELEGEAGGRDSLVGVAHTPQLGRITPVMEQLLPALRQYSSYLAASAADLVTNTEDSLFRDQLQELWRIYASVLNNLVSMFPISDLIELKLLYLLEEDENLLGFEPFNEKHPEERYDDQNGSDADSTRHGIETHGSYHTVEMLVRIRDLLSDGISLVDREDVPLTELPDLTIVYADPSLPSTTSMHPATSSGRLATQEITHVDETLIHRTPSERQDSIATMSSNSMSLKSGLEKSAIGEAFVNIDQNTDAKCEDKGERRAGDETTYDFPNSSALHEFLGNQTGTIIKGRPPQSSQPVTASWSATGRADALNASQAIVDNRLDIESTPSDMPDASGQTPEWEATGPRTWNMKNRFPQNSNYAGKPTLAVTSMDPQDAAAAFDFCSPEHWGSGQSYGEVRPMATPPNGQREQP